MFPSLSVNSFPAIWNSPILSFVFPAGMIIFCKLVHPSKKDAFYNCRAMTSFTAPNALQALGDNCFEGCATLTSVDFSGSNKDGNTSLRELGYHLFKGCSSLSEIQFPLYYWILDLSAPSK